MPNDGNGSAMSASPCGTNATWLAVSVQLPEMTKTAATIATTAIANYASSADTTATRVEMNAVAAPIDTTWMEMTSRVVIFEFAGKETDTAISGDEGTARKEHIQTRQVEGRVVGPKPINVGTEAESCARRLSHA